MHRRSRRPRIALPSLFLLAASGALTAASCADETVASGACPEGLTTCDGACVDIQHSEAHCGACGHACPDGAACASGVCVTACGVGLVSCGGLCVDALTDPANCGACGAVCPEGATCTGGTCLADCPEGLTMCGGACVDTQVNPAHCGGCDAPCAEGESCQAGSCEPCPPGQTQCGGVCLDTQTSNQNCGGCGLSCAVGFECMQGLCQSVCDPGESYCSGGCVDTQSNNQHCGFCNNGCFGGQTCQAGDCVCPTGVCGVCSVTDLGSTVPQTVTGDTFGAPDGFDPSCGSPSAADVAFTFTAPADGSYAFNTFGSSYDTVIAVTDPACGEIACDNDYGGLTWESKAVVDLTAGQSVNVIVDGYFGESGFFTLNVTPQLPPVCPSANLGSTVPQTVTGTTLGHGDAVTPGCAPSQTGDTSFTFTAPADGPYAFNTYGSAFNTVIHVRDGGCNGPEIACNDDKGASLQSSVAVDLTAGQTVVVAVDGYFLEEGDFTLNVLVPPPCPLADLGSTVPQTVTGDTTGLVDYLIPGCTASSGPEYTYAFTAPATGSYVFDTFGSSFDTVLHVHGASCEGPELSCNDNSMGGAQSRVAVFLSAGQTVIVAVDGVSGAQGPFTLNVTQGMGGACDAVGFCGDSSDGCIGCALNGPCNGPLMACQSSSDCIDYVVCIDPCPNQACVDMCEVQYPVGAAIYNQLVECAICVECYVSCDGAMSGCP